MIKATGLAHVEQQSWKKNASLSFSMRKGTSTFGKLIHMLDIIPLYWSYNIMTHIGSINRALWISPTIG